MFMLENKKKSLTSAHIYYSENNTTILFFERKTREPKE